VFVGPKLLCIELTLQYQYHTFALDGSNNQVKLTVSFVEIMNVSLLESTM
jgi:hypothetical protein